MHDVLLLNRQLLDAAKKEWAEKGMQTRTKDMTETILQIWQVPKGHRSGFVREQPLRAKKVTLSDLISNGMLLAGTALVPRGKDYAQHTVVVLPDGRLGMGDTAFAAPSELAAKLVGHKKNGWEFFRVGSSNGRLLKAFRREYIDAMAVDADDEDLDDDGDEDGAKARRLGPSSRCFPVAGVGTRNSKFLRAPWAFPPRDPPPTGKHVEAKRTCRLAASWLRDF